MPSTNNILCNALNAAIDKVNEARVVKAVKNYKGQIISYSTSFTIAVLSANALSDAINYPAPNVSIDDIEEAMKQATIEANNNYRNTSISEYEHPNMTCGNEDVYLQSSDALTYLDPTLCEPGRLDQILNTTPFWKIFINICVPLIKSYCVTINDLQQSLAEKHEQNVQHEVVIPSAALGLIIATALTGAEFYNNLPSRTLAWVGNRMLNSVSRGARYLQNCFFPSPPPLLADDVNDLEVDEETICLRGKPSLSNSYEV